MRTTILTAAFIVAFAVTLATQSSNTHITTHAAATATCHVGDVYVDTVSSGFYRCSAANTWTRLADGTTTSAAPASAQYWTGAADGTLSAEKNLGALGTGLVINTGGVPTAYAGSACSASNFVSSISASGAATCSVPAGTGAPTSATYITQTADGTLSAEQALSALSSGIMRVATTTGVITSLGDILPVANGGTGLASGTSGGVLAYTASGTLASSGALTANLPVIGGGAGVAPTVGTRSGNTTVFVTTTGTLTSGDCVKIDASGNFIANGSACGSGGGGTAFALQLAPANNEPPTANFAVLSTRNVHPELEFDASTAQSAVFTSVLPAGYAGGGLTIQIIWAAATATSGDVKWNAAVERIDAGTLDTDADSFASAQTTTTTANGTSGVTVVTSVTMTSGAQMDSLAAGELFRLKVTRDAADGADTMTGNAQVYFVIVKET